MRAGLPLISISSLFLLLSPISVFAQGPSLDLDDTDAIQDAVVKAMQNLVDKYPEQGSEGGNFNEDIVPWWSSATVWDAIFDYTKWSGGDTQFNDLAVGALANMSFKNVQDVLNGEASDTQGLMGRWNDDILWVALAFQNGVDLYGADTTMPGTGGGKWDVVGPKTEGQVFEESDDKCGGGIYWSRNRITDDQYYKSTITQTQYAELAAKIHIMESDQEVLDQGIEMWDWIVDRELLTSDGAVQDGVDVRNCDEHEDNVWTYNAGQAIFAGIWLAEATEDKKYLDVASRVLQYSASRFTTDGGVIRELCEPQCSRDPKSFKGVLARSLPYLYRTTESEEDKATIEELIRNSVQAMVDNTCDAQWNCGGNWSTTNTNNIDIADQHVSTSLLIAALGVFSTETEGIMPSLGELQAADVASAPGSAGAGPSSQPVMESEPLGAGSALTPSLAAMAFAGLFVFGTFLLSY